MGCKYSCLITFLLFSFRLPRSFTCYSAELLLLGFDMQSKLMECCGAGSQIDRDNIHQLLEPPWPLLSRWLFGDIFFVNFLVYLKKSVKSIKIASGFFYTPPPWAAALLPRKLCSEEHFLLLRKKIDMISCGKINQNDGCSTFGNV